MSNLFNVSKVKNDFQLEIDFAPSHKFTVAVSKESLMALHKKIEAALKVDNSPVWDENNPVVNLVHKFGFLPTENGTVVSHVQVNLEKRTAFSVYKNGRIEAYVVPFNEIRELYKNGTWVIKQD